MPTHTIDRDEFLKDVKAHAILVLRSNGAERHIRFKNPASSCYWFDLLTWPGALCIDGDCGTYVFKRTPDMFEFFRDGRGTINPAYWSEKVVSVSSTHDVKEFCEASFVQHAVETYRDYWRGTGRFADQREGFELLRDTVLGATSLAEMHSVLYDFEWRGFQFHDTWEWDPTRFSRSFLWNLHAIVWGIQQFDALAGQQQVAAA